MAKAEVMRGFGAKSRIVVNDGITDIQMARHADIVFARDLLAVFLDKAG